MHTHVWHHTYTWGILYCRHIYIAISMSHDLRVSSLALLAHLIKISVLNYRNCVICTAYLIIVCDHMNFHSFFVFI